jgi:hypothetical protein
MGLSLQLSMIEILETELHKFQVDVTRNQLLVLGR